MKSTYEFLLVHESSRGHDEEGTPLSLGPSTPDFEQSPWVNKIK